MLSQKTEKGSGGKKIGKAGSQVSSSGKKQKVKPVQNEGTRQSKIEKYFIRKQIQSFSDYENLKTVSSKGLGFTTPAFEKPTEETLSKR